MNLRQILVKSFCPVCESEDNVFVLDRGLKFWRRFIVGNNRFGCRACRITWRRKAPHSYSAFSKKSRGDASSLGNSPRKRRARRNLVYSLRKSRKRVFVACAIVIVSVAVSYYLSIIIFPENFEKHFPKPKIQANGNVANTGTIAGGRNDKTAGKRIIQNLKSENKEY